MSHPPREPSVEPTSPGGIRNGATGTIVALVLGLVAVIIGLSVISSGDEAASEDPPSTSTSSTSTTRPRRPDAARPEPDGQPRPIVEGAWTKADVELALIAVGHNGQVVTVDLASGRHHYTQHDEVAPVSSAAWFGDSLAVVGARGDVVMRLAPGGTGEWESMEAAGYQLEPSWGAEGMFWAWPQEGVSPGVIVANGTGWHFVELPSGINHLQGAGVIDGWAIFSGSDGIFAIRSAGEIRRLGFGRVIGLGGRYLVRSECDDQLSCRLVRDEVVDGRLNVDGRRDLGTTMPHWATPSPDGRSVALVNYSEQGPALEIVLEDGSSIEILGQIIDNPTSLRWVGDGDALVWMANGHLRFLRVYAGDELPGGGSLYEVQAQSVNLSRVGSSAGVMVVALADVPPALMPPESADGNTHGSGDD